MTTFPPMDAAVITKARWAGKQLFTSHQKIRRRLFSLDPNDRQWETQPQFLLQINLHVMETELLELDAAEVMNVGGVPFHFFELEFDFGLSQHVFLIRTDDPRALFKFSGATAPARPDAQ